ncbi:DUF1343 domain-containing protein [Opitutus terrae]|uniref:DUF1343 domain-containing protein n=1 Tax=Opitutus terrae (strain DSM 11246 / JCM 15787 / PB90-1) TaxID=452637 RepID=B1ZWV9_OPITP|nr:DUF1343 domain-containing protein [Opitutus terrae]ACB75070.1 conserved hypothetical protein [Opitutus terrae PB90-1]
MPRTAKWAHMVGFFAPFSFQRTLAYAALALGLLGCSASQAPTRSANGAAQSAPVAPLYTPPAPAPRPSTPLVLLGIDVLEAQGFAPVKGKRIGLLTHAAGVNRNGVSTIEVLRRAPGVKLVALFGVEHGIYGLLPAEKKYEDHTDARTGLRVLSLYNGRSRKPTKAQLSGLDAVVVDLQDIGTRSYTYVSAMKLVMEACFEHDVEVIVLDRPNPLGGLKADGPPLDTKWMSYVGAFRVPYVHGLTIAELARMAKEAPGVLAVSDAARARGRLTVVPMRGWRRSMRWPETGLTWIPTSPMVQDFSACVGYAMVGLGTYWDPPRFDLGFRHGVGDQYAFRGISHKSVKSEIIERELEQLKIPGLSFRRVSVPNREGKPMTGVFVEVTDWDEWNPTQLSFYLMQLACRIEKKNPFLVPDSAASGFLRHMGSEEFFRALQRDGANTNIAAFFADWQRRAKIYQAQSKRYWLYQ